MSEHFSRALEAAQYLQETLPRYERGAELPDRETQERIAEADRLIPSVRTFNLGGPDYPALALRVMHLEQRIRGHTTNALTSDHSDACDRT